MDILPSGLVSLKIKGELLTAMANIPLQKGESAFFKVTDISPEKNHLRLQFVEYVDKTQIRKELLANNFKDSPISKLIQQLTSLIHSSQESEKLRDIKTARLQNIHLEILKNLPTDLNLMPKDMRLNLETLLHESLKLSGEGIHKRLGEFLNQLPEGIKEHPIVTDIKKDLMVSIERMLQTPIKNIIQNTGVMLEPKLMAIAKLFLQIRGLDDLNYSQERQQPIINSENKNLRDAQQSLIQQNILSLKQDLKAGLLQLRKILINDTQNQKTDIAGQKAFDMELIKPHSELVSKIGLLIRDIETFQVLSKMTDSFYTFLPLIWHDLKDCDLSIKRGKRNAKGESYSCRINLDLEGLGKLSAVIIMLNSEFIIFFKTDNPQFETLLDNNIKGLYKSFSESKLNLKRVNFLKINEPIERIESLETDKGINTRV